MNEKNNKNLEENYNTIKLNTENSSDDAFKKQENLLTLSEKMNSEEDLNSRVEKKQLIKRKVVKKFKREKKEETSKENIIEYNKELDIQSLDALDNAGAQEDLLNKPIVSEANEGNSIVSEANEDNNIVSEANEDNNIVSEVNEDNKKKDSIVKRKNETRKEVKASKTSFESSKLKVEKNPVNQASLKKSFSIVEFLLIVTQIIILVAVCCMIYTNLISMGTISK